MGMFLNGAKTISTITQQTHLQMDALGEQPIVQPVCYVVEGLPPWILHAVRLRGLMQSACSKLIAMAFAWRAGNTNLQSHSGLPD